MPGEPQNALLAGNEGVAAIGGWTWEAGTIRPYLLTSTDRTTWAPVHLPESLRSSAVTHIALDGGRLVALVQGARRSAAIVVVDGTGTGDPTVTPVPAPPDGDRRTLGGMAIAGDTVVLIDRQGPTSGGPLLAFRSTDAGRTWSEPVTISPNEQADTWGVATGDPPGCSSGNPPANGSPSPRPIRWRTARRGGTGGATIRVGGAGGDVRHRRRGARHGRRPDRIGHLDHRCRSRSVPGSTDLLGHGVRPAGRRPSRIFLPFRDGGFRTINKPTAVGLAGNALSLLPWDPPEAADGEDVEIGVDGTAQVLLSSRMANDDQTHPVTGWFRSAPDQTWRPVTGFGVQPAEYLGEVKHLGRTLAAGGKRRRRHRGPCAGDAVDLGRRHRLVPRRRRFRRR